MTKEQAIEVIRRCNRIARGGKPLDSSCGLCFTLTKGLGLCYIQLQPYFNGWKHHSGVICNPIKDYDFRVFNRTLWKGEQLKLRRSLARHIAKQLKKEHDL